MERPQPGGFSFLASTGRPEHDGDLQQPPTATRPRMPTSWSLTARTSGRCCSASGRRSWRSCWCRRHRLRRAHRPGWRRGVLACLQDGPRRDRVEAAERALSVRAVSGLAQGQKPGQPGDAAGAGGRLVTARRALAARHWRSFRGLQPAGREPISSRRRLHHAGRHRNFPCARYRTLLDGCPLIPPHWTRTWRCL